MSGDFGEGIDYLIEQVGHGDLVGALEVDQVYAHYQEANDWLKHPRGGEAHALENSLYRENSKHMQHLADHLITEGGSELTSAMIDVVEDLSQQYFDHAPEEFGDLRASGHPTVTSDGEVVYDRTPNMHRLTEDELRAKGDTKRLFGRDVL